MQDQDPHTRNNFSLLQNVHTYLVIHPNPYSLGTGVLFLVVNRSGREVYHSRPLMLGPLCMPSGRGNRNMCGEGCE